MSECFASVVWQLFALKCVLGVIGVNREEQPIILWRSGAQGEDFKSASCSWGEGASEVCVETFEHPFGEPCAIKISTGISVVLVSCWLLCVIHMREGVNDRVWGEGLI